MAHNPNYFGFAHGGTQYTGQPAPYPAAQTAYVQAAAPQAAYATATAPRAQSAYDTYQTAATAGAYAYATTRAPTATYDATKAYYQPAPAATYTVQEAAYQTAAAAAKPVYAATAYQAPAAATRQIAAQKPAVAAQHVTQSNYSYTPIASHQTSNATYSTNTYTPASTTASAGTAQGGAQGNSVKLHGYDAALYSAATSYYQQQQGVTNKVPLAASATTNWFKKSTAFVKKERPKQPPKQPQLHYCDVCKISCAGPQTYREHLEGQKHKKKEAGQPAPAGRAAQNQLRCELCDVACTGSDAYAAHIRGAKHKKVLKLHTKLGKTIPSTEPVVITAPSAATASTPKAGAATATTKAGAKPIASTTSPAVAAGAVKKVMATPKINFLGGTQLKTAGTKVEEVKVEPSAKVESAESDVQDSDGPLLPGEKDIQPVGHEYIEEVKNEVGKAVSFNCKLCECKFNDPNAKEMHMKGRRHRLQYKKKVDPKLIVEVKPGIRMRKIQEDRMKRNMQREEYMKRRQEEERMMMEEEQHYWEERRRFEVEMMQRQPPFGPMGMRRPDTLDDRHVMHKHHTIYPKENELQSVQAMVTACEKALKLVSDHIAECDNPVKDEVKKEAGEGKDQEEDAPQRALKGVMRVGMLAKGLLLTGCLNVNLVILCLDKPTRSLLDRVADALPQKLEAVNDEKYEVRRCVEEAAIIVSSEKEPQITCTVTLTSPVMREPTAAEADVKDPPDVLDRQKCLDALASLRHAKWFQARANSLQSCVIVIRVMRDLCQRVPTWAPLTEWAMELLVEKCISSSSVGLAPGDALRRVFECLASGILMPGGPGLWDPCEKEPKDAAGNLTNQAREDITASAQHALRLVSFRQIHKVLGMDPLPSMRFPRPRFNPRKRRRTTSTGEAAEADATEGKKDRKEGEAEVKKEEVVA